MGASLRFREGRVMHHPDHSYSAEAIAAARMAMARKYVTAPRMRQTIQLLPDDVIAAALRAANRVAADDQTETR